MSDKIVKYLGIDWGEKRIGLSLGDSENKIAIPFKVVIEIDEILSAVKEEDIDEIIIGEPLAMNGDLTNKDKYLFFRRVKS